IKHLIDDDHVKKMVDRKLVYQLDSLAFWMYALRIAQKEDLWPKVEPTVLPPSDSHVVRPSIDPRSPLSVLYLHKEVPNPCKNVRLVTSFMHRKLVHDVNAKRLKKDKEIMKMSRVLKCGVCPNSIDFVDPAALITHVNTDEHLDMLLARGGQVDMEALFFWIDALSRASKNEEEAAAPARDYLNRKLVAGMTIRTLPSCIYGPLQHSTGVPDPCPYTWEAIEFLRMKMMESHGTLLDLE
ncbi:hypothetical protein PMAYCL1PPCAC_08311, partial [Pristionchus mayeri]